VERAGTDRAQKLVPRTLDEAVSISRAFNQGFMTSQYVEASAQVTEVEMRELLQSNPAKG
jgi:hypothetical protein